MLKSTTSLRERNKQEKLERIRTTARTLFRKKGFDATTISEIADGAGVAKGTVFLYAQDKHELLVLIFMEDIRAAMEKGFSTIPKARVIDQVVHVFTQFLQLYAKQPALAVLFIREVLVLKEGRLDEYNTITAQLLVRLAGLLDEAVTRKELRHDVDTMLAAQNLFALYAFTLLAWLQGRKPNVEEARDLLLHSFGQLWTGLERRRP